MFNVVKDWQMWTQPILFLPKFQELVGLAALNQMIYDAANQAERNRKRHRQRQICYGCGSSTRRVCFELINCRRYCPKCVRKPNCTVIDGLGKIVPIWGQIHAMTARKDIREKWQLQLCGFTELNLEKNDGILQIPWWAKLCVIGRQYEQPKEERGRPMIIFQLFEYLEQQEKEAWDGKEFKKEKMTVSTGVYGLAFIDGLIFFYGPMQ